MDPDGFSWSGVESSLAKHPVVRLFCVIALCKTCIFLPVVDSQFLEGVESRLRRSHTAQIIAPSLGLLPSGIPSSAMHGGGCLLASLCLSHEAL